MSIISGIAVKIAGTGIYLPEKVMTNADFETFLDTNDEWITTRTGIKKRHFAAEDEKCSDLAYKAAVAALEDAKMSASDIDMIFVGTVSPDAIFPSVSAKVQGLLGAVNAGAIDTSAGCTGSLSAMSVAVAGIASGIWNNVLVIGAESFRDILDWKDRSTCILFGDGAGACVLSAASEGEGRFVSVSLKADGAKHDYITQETDTPEAPRYVRMRGNDVFKFVSLALPPFISDFCSDSKIDPRDVDLWIMHQANTRIIKGVLKRLDVPIEKALMNLENYGNTSSASMMITLHEAILGGKVKSGDRVALVAFGAGMTFGAMLYEA